MKSLVAAGMAFLLLAGSAGAQDKEPDKSVLVATVPAQRGTLPDTLTAYGTAEPQPGSTSNISLPRAGQILDIMARPGQRVRQGDALLTFRADAAVVMAWNQALAALNLAREERAHVEQLLKQQLATRSQLAQADKAVIDAQAALDAQRREGGGQPVESVTAPFDGIVAAISVNGGDRIPAGASLITLLRADAIGVTIGIEAGDRSKVKPGAPVKLDPLDGGAAVSGTISVVGAMLDPKSRKIESTVAVGGDSVLPGAAFRATITVGELSGWIVPRGAVLGDGKSDRVFQIADGKATAVAVKIVGAQGNATVVDGNIDAARPIVTDGGYQLSDGMAVRTAPDATHPAAATSGPKS